ncbi:MAG: hypothetical protein Q9211_005402, partial [Gyalolechia sp. 1 TL-2023]
GCEFEDVDGVACGADGEEGACGVESHAVDAGGHAAAAELVELFGGGDGEDADDGSFVGCGGEEGASVVEGDAGEGGAVSFSDVDGFEFDGVEEENVAGCGGDVGGCWRGVRRMGRGQSPSYAASRAVHTDSEMAMVLVEGHKIHRHHRHCGRPGTPISWIQWSGAMENLSMAQAPMDGLAQSTDASEASMAMRIKDDSTQKGVALINQNSRDARVPAEKKAPRKMVNLSKGYNREEKVMETNNSSIVSKRSVERLYLPKPHFFQYFVRKPIRRSPLINRGYWLRMHVIEKVVGNFLDEDSEKHKIIVNLGCGYDPGPFRWITRGYGKGVTFVDVDYPELISKKRDVIMRNHEMESLISPVRADIEDSALVLSSERYMAVGCDLRDTTKLSEILEQRLKITSCLVLCVAEVSVTYMDVDSADALLRWAAQYNDVRFCMLEQCLPDGDKHPFAQKMLQHFEKLRSPLRCIQAYPTLEDQESRFLKAGYRTAHARTLCDLWQDDSTFMSPDLRLTLNSVEPFDEWEEFALFSSHYFLLEAFKSPWTTSKVGTSSIRVLHSSRIPSGALPNHEAINLQVTSSSNNGRRRRFGAMIQYSESTIGFYGGVGHKGRMQDTDRYLTSGCEARRERVPDPPTHIQARMCHTITRLQDGKDLLVGGRTSPDEALHGCWLRSSEGWSAVGNLPIPLYRHCATAVTVGRDTKDVGVLVFGGRTTGGASVRQWFLWQESRGWSEVHGTGPNDAGYRFGAAILATHANRGLLFGGMMEDGVLCDWIWEWSIVYPGSAGPLVQLERRLDIQISPRIGACLVSSPVGLLLIGGVSKSPIPKEEEILCLWDRDRGKAEGLQEFGISPVTLDFGSSRPLLVGHAACDSGNSVLVVGGGAVCFSFGAHWNEDIWTMHCSNHSEDSNTAQRWIAGKNEPLDGRSERGLRGEDSRAATTYAANSEEILRVKIDTAGDFDRLIAEGKPFVMEGLDIGNCTKNWTVEELIKKIGPDRIVTVHQAQDDHMNFQQKNFSYVKKPFGEFMREASGGSKQYLRSLAAEKPADQPACFYDDFPCLREDFHLPVQLETVSCNHHSSPLRISGPVNMWLHYDVMANILCQTSGSKIVALYSPSDAVHFRIPPGSSSSPVNVWADETHGRGVIKDERPYIRATLNGGDILYIPPLWLHSASPLGTMSIAINVFFKSLETGYSAGRDVYGNRDLAPYENGRKGIEKMVKAFDRLPRDIGSAYLERLANELKEKATGLRRS